MQAYNPPEINFVAKPEGHLIAQGPGFRALTIGRSHRPVGLLKARTYSSAFVGGDLGVLRDLS